MNINTINNIFAIGTILMQLAIIKIVVVLIFKEKFENWKMFQFARENALLVAFLIALISSLASLFYSEVIGFPPCDLCWFQRAFMYPQAIILGLALWKKELSARIYSMWLSVIGALIALYQVLLQFGVSDTLTEISNCVTDAADISCAKIDFIAMGYITFPVMSLTAFILIFLLAYFSRK